MAGLARRGGKWLQAPFGQGFLLLVILITLFLSQPLFTNRPLLAADLLFQLDPLWQPLAPSGFSEAANQVLSDQAFEFYPWQKFMRSQLAQGRLPLWNPYTYSGQPLLANAQSALFDPFNLIALLWPLAKSFVIVAFLRLLCAGTFTLLLALELGLSRLAAYLAMVVFTFGGPQIVWLLYPKASALVWLPAILCLSARLMRTGQWRTVGWLGLAMAAQLVSGHPETALYSLLLWLLFSGYWLWLRDGAGQVWGRRRSLLQLGVAAVLGVSAGAIQWLPVAEALLQSEILAARSQSALTWQSIFLQWQDWLAALTMLLPNFFGNPRYHTYWYPYSNYTEQTLYVGVIPLALALLVYLTKGKGRQLLFFATLGIISLGLALRLPAFPLLAEIPGLSVTNVGRLRSVYMLVVALLAGYGLDAVCQGLASGEEAGARRYRLLVRILLVLGVGAAVIAVGAYGVVRFFHTDLVELGRAQAQLAQGNPFFFRPLAEYLALAEVRVQQMEASFLPANWTMYLPLLLALLLPAVGEVVRRVVRSAEMRAQVLAGVIVALTVAELWLWGIAYNPTIAPADLYPTPPLVAALLHTSPPEQGEPYRVMGTGLALAPNVAMLFDLADIRGYDPIAPRRYLEVMNRLPGAVRVGHHLLFSNADAPFLDFLNVRYAFATGELGGRWQPVQANNGVTLYANDAALPRAFMAYAGQHAGTPDESLALTLAPNFDFRHSVVLEGTGLPPLGQPASAGVVTITANLPGEMRVQVDTAAPGILVVSDPYTSGWIAHMDGGRVPILIANHAFRAVPVPAGQHTITFQYRPLSFTMGAAMSAVSLLGLILLVIFAGRTLSERKA